MIFGFWKKLKHPIFGLAPMSNVTDAAFRFIIAKYGKPDVMWTEFVSCDGLMSKGKKNLMINLKYGPKERPIVAQIFGSKPVNFFKTAKLLNKLKFDGIDINLGCPDKNVEKQGAGAKLMLNPKLATKIILATMKGASKLPVSIKTRLGYNTNILTDWLPVLLQTNPAAITIHCRTRKEMSKVSAHWGEIKTAVKIRNKLQPGKNKTLILGNGDVKTIAEAYERVKETGCDGVMIGRAIFGNPWLFANSHAQRIGKFHVISSHSEKSLSHLANGQRSLGGVNPLEMTIDVKNKLKVLAEHTKLFEKYFTSNNKLALGGVNFKSFNVMKKHFKTYVNGFDNAKELRIKLMATKNAAEVCGVIKEFLNQKN